MDLPYRGGGDGADVKLCKLPQPICRPLCVQHLLELLGWHVIGICPQPRHDLGKLRREQLAGIHGHKLPDLHCRAAHLRQLIGDLVQIARRQQQITQSALLAFAQLNQPIDGHGARHAHRHRPKLGKTRRAARWHRDRARLREGFICLLCRRWLFHS